jgi:hypothetical protein
MATKKTIAKAAAKGKVKTGAGKGKTIDPKSITSASQIPPKGSKFVGTSPNGLVDVFNGTLSGDIDAVPAAQEMLSTAPDTGGKVNAEYIVTQIGALYGDALLPPLQSPSGKTVSALVFVSGSAKGGYGAFHLSSSQTDFDKMVVDSLNSSGSYSSGSGLARTQFAAAAMRGRAIPHLFPMSRGPHGLRGITDPDANEMKAADTKSVRRALASLSQSRSALAKSIESHSSKALPGHAPADLYERRAKMQRAGLIGELVKANRDVTSLVGVASGIAGGRQHLSTALFCAELIESFQLLTGKGDAGRTDGEAVSRVVSFKLAPEITLVPGFNSGVTQDWWTGGHPDFVNDNSEDDQSENGNGAGVAFLLFLNDFLGVPMDAILAAMPAKGGAPLGETYAALAGAQPGLAQVAGTSGKSAFRAMIQLLEQNAQAPDGTLILPADGNPFPAMANSQQGGLFAH